MDPVIASAAASFAKDRLDKRQERKEERRNRRRREKKGWAMSTESQASPAQGTPVIIMNGGGTGGQQKRSFFTPGQHSFLVTVAIGVVIFLFLQFALGFDLIGMLHRAKAWANEHNRRSMTSVEALGPARGVWRVEVSYRKYTAHAELHDSNGVGGVWKTKSSMDVQGIAMVFENTSNILYDAVQITADGAKLAVHVPEPVVEPYAWAVGDFGESCDGWVSGVLERIPALPFIGDAVDCHGPGTTELFKDGLSQIKAFADRDAKGLIEPSRLLIRGGITDGICKNWALLNAHVEGGVTEPSVQVLFPKEQSTTPLTCEQASTMLSNADKLALDQSGLEEFVPADHVPVVVTPSP